jgi:FMN phosphatase YigB (HAD superfamily)
LQKETQTVPQNTTHADRAENAGRLPGGDGIKGVIFDLDGTLYHMHWLLRPLLTLQLLPHALRLPRYMKVRTAFSGKDLGSGQALLSALAAELARRSSNVLPDQAQAWIMRRFYPAFVRIMPFFRGSRPGLNRVLDAMRSRGIRCAVISDFAFINERLAGLNIAPAAFDITVSSESEGCLKPSPRPFVTLARSWGCEPDQIMVIGDRDDTDGAAARECGMRFIQIGDTSDSTIHRWPAVRSWLETLAGTKSISR